MGLATIQLWGKMRCRQILLLRIQFNDNTYFQFLNAKKIGADDKYIIYLPGWNVPKLEIKTFVKICTTAFDENHTRWNHYTTPFYEKKIFIVPLLPHNQSVQILFNFLPLLHYLLFTLNVCLFGNYKKSKA